MREPPKFDLLNADFRKEPLPQAEEINKPCCGGGERRRFDFLLWCSLGIIVVAIVMTAVLADVPGWLARFSGSCLHLIKVAWWAVGAGILSMAVLSQMPKELVGMVLGRAGTWNGILRATAAGVFFDLCNHGILMVAMGLYKRGASLGQTLAFLIASPWNSLSMTLLLSALVGWKWMLIFVLLSALVGMATGYLVELLTRSGVLPANPHGLLAGNGMGQRQQPARILWRMFFRNLRLSPSNIMRLLRIGIIDSRMIVRWILLGFVMTAAVKAFMPHSWFQHGFGPTLGGLLLTLLVTSVIEVCSEGSSPLAAEIFHTSKAPGNAFAFLMAGAATDYTEIMAIKSTTQKWSCALIMPILTLPQVLFFGWLLNQ